MFGQKQLIAGVIIIALLLLGVGGYFLFSKNLGAPAQNQTTNSNDTSTKAQDNSAMSSLIDLVTSGKTTQCTFDVATNSGSSRGTLFIAGEKMRGDFETTTEDGKTSQMYMIRDNDMYYVWGGELPSGIKMTFDVDQLKTSTQANQYVDLNTKADYSCSDWTTDTSKFIPPSNIKFTDISAMMDGSENSDSSVCESITDAQAKAACENALKQ